MTSQYVQNMSIITKSPKNETSYCAVRLSSIMSDLLRDYQPIAEGVYFLLPNLKNYAIIKKIPTGVHIYE